MNDSVFTDLHVLNDAVYYRKWLFSLIRPHVGQRVLEVGSGIGNYTEMLLDRTCVAATDVEQKYVAFLQERFAKYSAVHVLKLDLENISDETADRLTPFDFDTVINMNVLEHIHDDVRALGALKNVLSLHGKIILVVPSHQALFGSLDTAYGHYRRYHKGDIKKLSRALGMSLVEMRYFNFVGIMGWMYHGKIRKKRTLSQGSVAVFDRWIVPIVSIIERFIHLPCGLSLMAVLRKTPNGSPE